MNATTDVRKAQVSYRKLAFLSNGLTAAMELEGSIDWFPCPRFDSPSIFSRILDKEKGGYFSLRPAGRYRLNSSYVKDTLVLRNVFTTTGGVLETKDFMPLSLSGIMRVYRSSVPFVLDIKPMFKYGLAAPEPRERESGIIFKNKESMEALEVVIRGRYSLISGHRIRMERGSGSVFALYSKDIRYGLFSNAGFVYPEPGEALSNTVNYWRTQLSLAQKVPVHMGAYSRSIAVVLGMIYAPSGAIIAAPTTSLPEITGKGRNWDYRYLWIRDASYAAEALACAGYLSKARRIIDFMLSVLDPASKSFDHPLYSIDGTPPSPERTLYWLAGSRGSGPVRTGNSAYMQVQMDIEGEFMNALYAYLKLSNDLSYAIESWWAVEAITKWVGKAWRLKSTSLWEEHEERRHYVHTNVMQWVAVDRARLIAMMIGYAEKARELGKVGDEIRSDVLSKGFSKKANSFVKYYGSTEVDASLLTLPLYGFIKADDPRFLSTLERIERELLAAPGLLLRYRSDFLGEVLHPFTLLSTWLARVYLRTGERKKAEDTISALLERSTELQLLGEHVDVRTSEPMGNLPQLFPHAGLVQALSEFRRIEL